MTGYFQVFNVKARDKSQHRLQKGVNQTNIQKIILLIINTMLYMIYSTDVENSLEKRLATRPAHIARITKLHEQGRVYIAGPLPATDSNEPGDAGFTGSLVVAEFDSLEDAKAWASEDPYMTAGVYAESIVKPFKKVF